MEKSQNLEGVTREEMHWAEDAAEWEGSKALRLGRYWYH